MSNSILTIDKITKEALMILENELGFTKGCNREYSTQFAKSGAKIGDTVRVRKPARYTVRNGASLSAQDHTETSVNVQLDNQKGVDVNFTSKELTLDLDDFSKRVLQPAISQLANEVDRDGLQLYKKVSNAVGTIGNTPSTLRHYLNAKAKLDLNATPMSDRHIVQDPLAQVEIVDALKGLFQSSEQISDQYEKGVMGIAAGFKWKMDQNVVTHTVGAHGGTPLVNGASQTGASLATDGWTNSTTGILKEGDVFTIDDVYAVNPLTRQSTGQLMQFTVTADVDSGASTGPATIPISPAIVTSGAFQNVSAGPADNAGINVLGAASASGAVNMAFHRDAFTLATADLMLPQGVHDAAVVRDKQLGISIRMVRQYDINSDTMPCRLDILYGWEAIRPELACRVFGTP